MFLKNWYKGLAGITAYSSEMTYKNVQGYNRENASTSAWFVPLSSATKNSVNMKNVLTTDVLTTNSAMAGVIFGNGATPPTIDDYFLSGDQITGIEYTSNVSSVIDDNGVTVTGVYTITNNNTSDITISEVGLVGPCTTGTPYYYWRCMVERTLLDTPVVIPAGGIGQVTYTIRFNYPTA